MPEEQQLLPHLHEVLLHVVGHELHNFLLAVQLLGEGGGREGEVLVVGQAVVDGAVQSTRPPLAAAAAVNDGALTHTHTCAGCRG